MTTMAGAVITPSYRISGLHYNPTTADLKASSDTYVPRTSSHDRTDQLGAQVQLSG